MSDDARGRRGADDDLTALDRAIDALEAQRPVLGDAVVDTALVPLQGRRAALAAQAQGERRKLVTIVFADLVGFTDLSGRLDPEDTRNIVDAYFARWRREIEKHKGVVEKFIGDAVMAVFGLHQSWEDDAQRAVRCALAMVGDLESLNVDIERRHGVRLRMRVGIDTGDVVVSTLGERGDDDFVAVGPTVNRAARLQAAAPVDGVLISVDTHRLVRGRFSMQPVEDLELKGFDRPVRGFLVVSERPVTFRLDRSTGVEGVDTATVGREIELQLLQERLLDVVDEQRWQVVTVVGEAGVGKSRLLLDFDSWLAERSERVFWYRGRVSQSDQNRANALLRDVVASRCRIVDSDPSGEVLDKLEVGLAAPDDDRPTARRRAEIIGAWLGFDLGAAPDAVPQDPQALRDAGTELLASYFAGKARQEPVVILLEDLHWADDGSLRWLDAADAHLRTSRVLVVATARPTLLEERPRWSEGLDHHVHLHLNPLSRRQSRALLAQIFRHVDHVPDRLVELVIDSAEGNPFYLEELVTWLIDSGVVVKGEPTWHVVAELVGTLVVPSTLRGVLQARLDGLSAPERTLLQRASVLGRVFWDDAVQRLGTARGDSGAGSDHDVGLPATLEHLRSRELVLEREISAFEEAREFLFKHALLRDVAYEGVLRVHRQHYHRLAAGWLAEMSARSGRSQEYAALVAHHYDEASAPEAAEWYLRAGRRATDVYALDEATRLLARCLDLAVDDPVLRFDALRLREAVLDRIGDRAGQLRDLTEMQALLQDDDDPGRRVALALAEARYAFTVSEYDAVEAKTEVALSVARAGDGMPRQQVEALLWLGKSLTWRDQGDDARSALSEALTCARQLGSPGLVGEALRYLSMVANNEGRLNEAVQLADESAAQFRAAGDLEGEAMALTQRGTTQYNLGRIDLARETLEETLLIFRRSGHRYREAIVLGNLASIALSQGHLTQARVWARQATDVQASLGDPEALITDLTLQAQIATAVGQWDDALRLLDEAVAKGRTLETRQSEAYALSALAVVHLERGAPTDALEAAREACRVAHGVSSRLDQGNFHLALGYAEEACGAPEAAEAAYDEAEQAFTEVDSPISAREAAAGRASVLLSRGELHEAAELVRPLVPDLDRAGLDGAMRPTALSETVWRVLAAAGDPGAEAVLRAARAYIEDTAHRIGDDALREGYVSVPVNARLLAAPAG
jgi:class 3 adenylate cyclase/tetratricopeptide (TPR) repeat protein